MKIIIQRLNNGKIFVLLLISFLIFATNASATTIREVSVSELVTGSELVFEGIVIDVRTRKSDRGAIVTDVTFEVLDVIKGTTPSPRLKLSFLGGRHFNQRLVVSHIDYPKRGERGIYFAESPETNLINPLLGWNQGRFLVAPDSNGSSRVLTADKRPVIGFDAGIPMARRNAAGDVKISRGVARGVIIRKGANLGDAMTAHEFKRSIRGMEEAGNER